MSQLILVNGSSKRRFSMNKLANNFILTPYLLIVSLVLTVGLVTVITLMFSAKQITKGYVLDQLGDERANLLVEGQKYDMDIFEIRSLDYVSKSNRASVMVPPSNVAFVRGDTAVASR